jgi:hypothetical protein
VITTPDLLNALATDVPPVRRLRSPVLRALAWLLLAALILTLLAIGQGLRPDLSERLQDLRFLFGVAGALSTGLLSAIAAFVLSLPDRSRLWVLLPVPALGLWLSTLGYQCLTDWISLEPGGLRAGETARCFATLVLMSLPLSMAMLVMLRHAAPLRPTTVTLAGSLAVAALTAVALSLLHGLDATLMILIWNLGTSAILIGLGSTFGRKMFSWVAPQSGLHKP